MARSAGCYAPVRKKVAVPSRLRRNLQGVPGGNDQVLVVLDSILTDDGVISAAEQVIAGDAAVRYLRVVPRDAAFSQALAPVPQPPGEPRTTLPTRIVATGDDMAATLISLSRELKITLLALGEPPREPRRKNLIRRALSKLLARASMPVLYVPPSASGPRDDLRRILIVLHAPYPAYDLLERAVSVARRSHAEVSVLSLPSARPQIPDQPPLRFAHRPSLAFSPFDAAAWLEKECERRGCRVRPVESDGSPAESILKRARAFGADLVIAGAGLADLRAGWWRRRILDVVLPRLCCPLLFGPCA
jgi:nucleotide-binding universal stress UspA family protein